MDYAEILSTTICGQLTILRLYKPHGHLGPNPAQLSSTDAVQPQGKVINIPLLCGNLHDYCAIGCSTCHISEAAAVLESWAGLDP